VGTELLVGETMVLFAVFEQARSPLKLQEQVVVRFEEVVCAKAMN
jgi:hypothetical protein